MVRDLPRPLPNPHLVRRLTDEEMEQLISLARAGRKGPAKAMDALWDLILREVEGMSLAEATERNLRWHVQSYAIADDQSRALFDAFMLRRRLPPKVVAGFGLLWLQWTPRSYMPDEAGPE